MLAFAAIRRRISGYIFGAGVALGGAAPQPVLAAEITPQQIIAALERDLRDPTRLSKVPLDVEYMRASEPPLSGEDRARGILAHFVIAMNYKDPLVSEGATYRVFRNMESAEGYWKNMSTANSAGFRGNVHLFPSLDDDYKWPGRKPYQREDCESFISTSNPNVSNTRCYALHIDLPVIVSGVRVDPVQLEGSGGAISYPGWEKLQHTQLGWATTVLDEAMSRLDEIERETGR